MAVAEPYLAPVRAADRQRILPAGSRMLDWAAAGLLVPVTVIALLAPVLAPHDPIQPVGLPQLPPGSGGFLLGTDSIGRDILSRVLIGWRSSWFAALVAIVWWPFYARIVRGEIRSLAARPHVEAARLAGVGPLRIAFRHLLPGAVPAAIVTASLDVGNLVLTLAALSFLGLGQPQPAPELGADTARNLSYLLQQWWIPVMPGFAVMLLALAGNLAGDGLRNLLSDR